jgi:hypothetical protein
LSEINECFNFINKYGNFPGVVIEGIDFKTVYTEENIALLVKLNNDASLIEALFGTEDGITALCNMPIENIEIIKLLIGADAKALAETSLFSGLSQHQLTTIHNNIVRLTAINNSYDLIFTTCKGVAGFVNHVYSLAASTAILPADVTAALEFITSLDDANVGTIGLTIENINEIKTNIDAIKICQTLMAEHAAVANLIFDQASFLTQATAVNTVNNLSNHNMLGNSAASAELKDFAYNCVNSIAIIQSLYDKFAHDHDRLNDILTHPNELDNLKLINNEFRTLYRIYQNFDGIAGITIPEPLNEIIAFMPQIESTLEYYTFLCGIRDENTIESDVAS